MKHYKPLLIMQRIIKHESNHNLEIDDDATCKRLMAKCHQKLAQELGPEGSLNDSGRFDNKGKWLQPPLLWQTESPESLLQCQALIAVIEEAIAKLPFAQQAVILLHDVEGLVIQDICSHLAMSSSNARVLLHRARIKLRDAVEEYVGWES